MIEINEIFSDSDKRIAIWCENTNDTNDLAIMCENIINNDVRLISVPPESVSNVWTYLEKTNIKILTRFNFTTTAKTIEKDMYEFSENVTSVCKSGANGVQVFLSMHIFEQFVDILQSVRDDLFFGKDLDIVLDISDIDNSNFKFLFQKLRDIRADVLTFTLNEDMGNRSDFVGRIYGLLQNWDFDGDLHFILGNNFDRIDQVVRLTEILRPEVSDKLRFFLDY